MAKVGEIRSTIGAPSCRDSFMIVVLSLPQQNRAWHIQTVWQISFCLSNEFYLESIEFKEITGHPV